jgi:hypothetical protein
MNVAGACLCSELKSRPKRAYHQNANRRRRGDIVEDFPHLSASCIIQSIALQPGHGIRQARGGGRSQDEGPSPCGEVTADYGRLSSNMRAGTITHVAIR